MAVRLALLALGIGLVLAYELPGLLRKRRYREIWAVGIILGIAGAVGAVALVVPEVPSIAQVVIWLVSPVGEWLLGPMSSG